MKRIIPIVVLIFGIGTTHAQTANDSIKQLIREIKLSEQYVYGEANGADIAETKQTAFDKLNATAIEILIENGKTKAETAELWRNAESAILRVGYQTGPMYKAFAYIPKDILSGNVAAPQPEPAAEEPAPTQPEVVGVQLEPVTEVPVPAQPEVAKPQPEVPATTPDNSLVLSDSMRHAIEAQLGKMPLAPKPAGSIQKNEIDDNRAKDKVVKSLSALPLTPVEVNPLNNVSPKVKRTLEELLAMDTYESLMLYLDTMKDDGRLIYGSLKRIIRPERAYFIVVKDGKLETILNKGGMERVNLKTNQPESVEKYLGHGIIWLQIFE